MFAMLSDQTYFNDKLDLFVACAPIVYLNHCEWDTLTKISNEWLSVYVAANVLTMYEVNNSFMIHFREFCTEFGFICDLLMSIFKSETPYSDDEARKTQD